MQLLQQRDVCVATVDLRGHGESHKAPPPHSLEEFCRDLDVIMGKLSSTEPEVWAPERVVVVGHSYGGNLALQWVTTSKLGRCVRLCVCVDGGYISLNRHFATADDAVANLVPAAFEIPAPRLPQVLMQWFPAFSPEAINAFLSNFTTDMQTDRAELRLAVETHKDILRDLWQHPPTRGSGGPPIVVMPTGDNTPFAPDKHADVASLQALALPLEVRWFPDENHLFPFQSPTVLMEAVMAVMDQYPCVALQDREGETKLLS